MRHLSVVGDDDGDELGDFGRIAVAFCCAEADVDFLDGIFPALESAGMSPWCVEGVDLDPEVLTSVLRNDPGPSIYVIAKSDELDDAEVHSLVSLFSARRGPMHRLLVVALDQRGAYVMMQPIRRAAQALKRQLRGRKVERAIKRATPRGAALRAQEDTHPLRDRVGPIPRNIVTQTQEPSPRRGSTPPVNGLLTSRSARPPRPLPSQRASPPASASAPARTRGSAPPPTPARRESVAPHPVASLVSRIPRPWLVAGLGAVAAAVFGIALLAGSDDAPTGSGGVAEAAVAPTASRPNAAVPNGAVGADVARPEPPPASRTSAAVAPVATGEQRGSNTTPPAAPQGYVTNIDSVRIDAALDAGTIHALDLLLVHDPQHPSLRTRVDWHRASKRCSGRSVAGLRGWRLPTIAEVRKLRYARQLPKGRFWTRSLAQPDVNWVVDTSKNLPEAVAKNLEDARALCVRRR